MPVKMRLHRVGAKHQPSYRIVITPALSPRDGSYLDQIGYYNPVTEPATISIDSEKAIAWLKKGVQPTDRVARLLSSVSIDPSSVRKPEPVPAGSGGKTRRTRSASEPATEKPAGAEPPKARRRASASAAGAEDATEATASAETDVTDEPEPAPAKRSSRKKAEDSE